MVTRAQSIMSLLTPDSAAKIEATFVAMQDRIRDELKSQGAEVDRIRFDRAVFAMYRGQTWDNRIAISDEPLTADKAHSLAENFHQYYQDSYGFAAPELPVVVSTLEVTAVIQREFGKVDTATEEGDALLRTTPVTLPGTTQAVDVPIHVRERLVPHEQVVGPALIAEKFATTVVLSGRVAHLDDDLNLIIEPQG
jgi:N-methylhydantoinase A